MAAQLLCPPTPHRAQHPDRAATRKRTSAHFGSPPGVVVDSGDFFPSGAHGHAAKRARDSTHGAFSQSALLSSSRPSASPPRGPSLLLSACGTSSLSPNHQLVVSHAVARLRALFPSMDDDVVRGVLDSCQHDVEAAIAKLTSLRVSAPADATPPPPPHNGATAAASTTTDTAFGGGTGGETTTLSSYPKTPDEWVGAFVDEMRRATDVADARRRAAKALEAFEKFVEARHLEHRARLEKENQVLKRAVAIQAQRLAEARDARDRDAQDLHKLKKTVEDQTNKLKQAHLSNYSLSVHLRRATDGQNYHHPGSGGSGAHGDVF